MTHAARGWQRCLVAAGIVWLTAGFVAAGGTAEAAGDAPVPRGFDAATSAVVGRAARQTDYANADGTYTAKLATHSVNFQAPDGNWRSIDNTVRSDPEQAGGFVNAANSWRVHFGSTAQGVAVDTGSGALAITPEGAAPVSPAVSGETGVVYREVWPGTDLRYTVTGDAVKESVLIKSRDTGSSFAFGVRSGVAGDVLRRQGADSTSLARQPDGSWRPVAVPGDAVGIEAPTVVRADGQPVAAAGATLTASAGRVVLSVDPQWLAAQPDSAFPIDLDPSIFVHPNDDRAFKSDGTTCSGSSCMIQVGNARDGGDTNWRTVAHFPYESLFGNHVLGVSIGTGWQAGTQNAYGIRVYWASSYSFAGAVRGSVLASGTPGTSGAALSGSGLTSQVSSWMNARQSGGAFGFVGTETAGLYTYQKFDMALFVNYDRPPATPSGLAFATPAHGCATGSARPSIDGTFPFALKATLSDPDGNNVKGYFELWNLAHTGRYKAVTSAVVGSGKAATVTFPANALPNGTTFAWRVRAWDGYIYGAWSGWCEATIHDPPPSTPTAVKFSSPAAPCVTGTTRPAMRGDQTISLTATIADPDRRNIYATFQVVKTGAAATVYWTGKSATVKSGSTVTVTMPANKVPEGTTFSWHVRTQNATYSTLVSPWSGWCEATVDNTRPPVPQIDSPDFGTAGTGVAAGTVGVPGTITAASPAPDTVKYVWSLTDLPATPPACGQSAGGATTLCVSPGAPLSFTLEPMEAQPTVHVRAYDRAGNYADGQTTFFVNEVTPSHGWLTDYAEGTETTLPDLPSANPAAELTISSPAWVDDGPFLAGPALHLDGTPTSVGTTPAGVIDPTKSFSIVVSARNPVAVPGAWQHIYWDPAFALALDPNNHYLFCLQRGVPPDGSFDADCAWSGVAPSTGWDTVFVVHDAAAHQVRLYVNGALAASTAHLTTVASGGGLWLGCGVGWDWSYQSCLTGDVADPVVYPGVLDQDQIDFIALFGFGG